MIDFKIDAADARISILGFTEILRPKDQGYANTGEENNDLGIQDSNNQAEPQALPLASTETGNGNEDLLNANTDEAMRTSGRETSFPDGSMLLQNAEALHLTSGLNDYDLQTQTNVSSDFANETSQSGIEQHAYDVWPPFFHPTILDVLPDGEMLNLPQVNMDSLDLDFFEPEDWFMSTYP